MAYRTENEEWKVVGGNIAVEFDTPDVGARMRVERMPDGSYAGPRPSGSGPAMLCSNGATGWRKWREFELIEGLNPQTVDAGHKIMPNSVDWPEALRELGYPDLADRFPVEWIDLGDDLYRAVLGLQNRDATALMEVAVGDDLADLIARIRRLLAACPTVDDFLAIRPMSLGLAVCGVDAFDPRTRLHAVGWLAYWGPRLDKPRIEVDDALIHLSHAKWNEGGGVRSELSTRSIYAERERLGIAVPHLLCGDRIRCSVCRKAHSEDNVRRLNHLRVEVARELDIPPYMLGVV